MKTQAQPNSSAPRATRSGKPLSVIGNSVQIKVAGISDIPAKVDTGATVSSIWASNIRLTSDDQLEFSLFGPQSPLYTGERLSTKNFKVRKVRNSTGQESVRYMVVLSTTIKNRRMRISYTLADRSRNDFPVLIGRKALNGKFLVDVSRLDVPYPPRPVNNLLNSELKADPKKFHQKYMS